MRLGLFVFVTTAFGLISCAGPLPSEQNGRNPLEAATEKFDLFTAASQPSLPVASGVTVVAVGSTAKIRPTDIVTGSPSASLIAARNEFESFQVMISAGPLAGPSHSNPRPAFPIDVPAGENRVAWVDILVPLDASMPKITRLECRCSSRS